MNKVSMYINTNEVLPVSRYTAWLEIGTEYEARVSHRGDLAQAVDTEKFEPKICIICMTLRHQYGVKLTLNSRLRNVNSISVQEPRQFNLIYNWSIFSDINRCLEG